MIRKKPVDAVAELLRAAFGTLRAGETRRGTLTTDDGLEVTLEIKVARHAGTADLTRYRNEVLEEIASGRRRAVCTTYTQRRGYKGGYSCAARAAAAIIYTNSMSGTHGMALVCGRHVKHHLIEPRLVLATVHLAQRSVEGASRAGEAKRVAEREAKIAEARAAGKPVCKRCGVASACCVPPCEFEERPPAPALAP